MANPKGNPQNLKPFKKGHQSHETAVKRGRKGGQAFSRKMAERKSQQQLASDLLNMPLDAGDIDDITYLKDANGKNLPAGQLALIVQMQKALSGDSRAYEIVRDTAGEKPAERIEINADVERAKIEIAALVESCKKRHQEDDGR